MNSKSPELLALEDAVEVAGGQSALAVICEVSQPAVWYWLNRAKKVPADKVHLIEKATGISQHRLRPDIYPASQSGTAA